MASRIVAAFAAVVLLMLLAALSVPLFFGIPAPAVLSEDPNGPVAVLEQPTSGGLLRAELFLLPNLDYRLDLLVSLDPEAPGPQILRPTVILEMDGMGMGRTEPPLLLLGMGEFSASGTFQMPGQWRFRVGFGDELFDLRVAVPAPSPSGFVPASGSAGQSFGNLANFSKGTWL